MIKPPFYPIVYLRGYAGNQGEIEDAVAAPYTGFNRGSTRLRQHHTGAIRSHVFESPVIRLMKDHDYVDAYHDGQILPKGPAPSRSIWIFRYHDVADEALGDGKRREIEFHATKLGEFLRHIRNAVLRPNEQRRRFRVHLVAHSMGGLICRCYLQNPEIPDIDGNTGKEKNSSTMSVDKVFTYGTPHGGIEFRRGLGWVGGLRDFFDPNNAGNFGPRRIREFLALPDQADLRSLNGQFPEERVFCLVGTDARDYGAAAGLAKRSVGPLSDGLVQIRNASVLGAPRALVHRSHSGHFGLVNSESGYQNLRRFLFGDMRILFEMSDICVTLPPRVERLRRRGAQVRASYHIDAFVSVRGVPVELNRRTYDEGSAIFRSYARLTAGPTRLFSAYLMAGARVNTRRRSLGVALRLQVRVPDYETDGAMLLDDHYEGGILFSDKLNLEIPPQVSNGRRIKIGWDSRTPNLSPRSMELLLEGNNGVGMVPFASAGSRPGISGNLRLKITPWNARRD